jgi:uncharacterized protein (DUF2141 family)
MMMAAALALATASASQSDGSSCGSAHRPAVLVHVAGLKPGGGVVRVQAYGPDPRTFLEKGRYVKRVETPQNGRSSVDVCVALPRAGRYAIAVRHDANRSGKSDWNDGGGFSRNPKLSLMKLKPSFESAVIAVPDGQIRTRVVMNYRRGLSIGPLG